jgi:type IV pilus assembly protein PilW
MRARVRGLSIVELLVATAIGLVVVAAAGAIVLAQHAAARKLQAETRLMHDLRTAADLVARDLRRAGHWSGAATSAVRRGDAPAAVNPHAALAPASAAASEIALSFSTSDDGDLAIVDDRDRFGFRLRGGAIEMQLGARNWQTLTDSGTLVVTAFAVEPRIDEISLDAFCERPCAAAGATCPPRQQVRSFAITLAARSATDSAVSRTLRSSVRTRNDTVVGRCEG